jgi:hypothetical protein
MRQHTSLSFRPSVEPLDCRALPSVSLLTGGINIAGGSGSDRVDVRLN